MISTVSKGDFRDAFHRMGRSKQFSYEGLGVLYEHLEEIDPEWELDVIALCCDYSEMAISEALENYDLKSIDELEENTIVLHVDDETVIYQAY